MVLAVVLAAGLGACATQSGGPSTPLKGPNLGRAPSAAELAEADISIPPSGAGLPAGSATAREGAGVYAAKCQSCHGEKGVGKPADALVGGARTLDKPNATRTVGSYWPHATTLFDYIRRAMPSTAPMSLTNQEVYAVTAYVLSINGIVAENAPINAQTLPQVRMPNRDGFIDFSNRR